tara:strand:+ start:2602 stop:3699 length:1098 start_codon:yes stop_codon:yes gene_type:complete
MAKTPIFDISKLTKRQQAAYRLKQAQMGVKTVQNLGMEVGAGAAMRQNEELAASVGQDTPGVQDLMASFIPPKAGILQTPPYTRPLAFQRAPDSEIIGHDDASIVFGRDRPASLASGWGAKGANKANTIDMVVGRMSSARQGDGPPGDSPQVGPSICADAARIYISQLTDVDMNFGIADGRHHMSNRSSVAIKADGVRLIGREGIKLVTGRSFAFKSTGKGGEPNSLGGEIKTPAPPIELLAGNSDGVSEFGPTKWLGAMSVNNLQGVAKGENTRDALRSLSRVLGQLIGTVYMMSILQNAFNSVIGINWLQPHYGLMSGFTGIQYCAIIQNSLWHTRINKIIWELNYAYPIGYKYITSKNVYST